MKITFLEVFTRVGVSRVNISVWTNTKNTCYSTGNSKAIRIMQLELYIVVM